MEHLINLVLFLRGQELAFRDLDESSDSLNKENFRKFFDMQVSEIQVHITLFNFLCYTLIQKQSGFLFFLPLNASYQFLMV